MDLFDFNATKEFIIDDTKPNVVINAAAKVGGILANNEHGFDFITENLKINMNILEALKSFPEVKLLILVAAVFYPLNTN